MITHYSSIVGLVDAGFEIAVQAKITDGWQPYGSPYMTRVKVNELHERVRAVQVIVKYAPKADVGTKQISDAQ